MSFCLLAGMLIGIAIGFRAGRVYDKPAQHDDVLCDRDI